MGYESISNLELKRRVSYVCLTIKIFSEILSPDGNGMEAWHCLRKQR